MALQDVTKAFLKRLQNSRAPLNRAWSLQCRRYASGEAAAAPEISELEESDFLKDTAITEEKFDPVEKARKRKKQLPPSRYCHLPQIKRSEHLLMSPTDTNSAHHATTAAPSTHTNPPNPPTQRPENSSRDPSPSHASNKPTTTPSNQTS